MSIKVECNASYQDDDLISGAVQASKNFNDITDANRYFMSLCEKTAGFVKIENNVYRYKDYFINAGKRFAMAVHADCIMKLAGMELSCIPEGVAYVWLDNDHDMVLFTRIKGSEARRLIPYNEAVGVSEKARRRLLEDTERLMEKNYAILAVTEGKDSWYVIEGEDRIIFSQCSLAFVSDAAKAAYRKRVAETLGL